RVQPPPERELAVLAEFDRRKGLSRLRWMGVAGLTAAAFAAVLLIPLWHSPAPVAPAPKAVVESEEAFVPIPYITPLAPYERADIVRVDLPVTALIAAGLSAQAAEPGATAQVDVVVGQDGRAHAVRLVSIVDAN
ncbi:MAG: hypothetical protein JO307_14780, partial [Bryobacterales bacterium]|nr:hypothetical protein [Bryobacterales bacterium]